MDKFNTHQVTMGIKKSIKQKNSKQKRHIAPKSKEFRSWILRKVIDNGKNNSLNIWILNNPKIWGTHLNRREVVMNINRLSLGNPKLLYVFKRDDCDKNDFFFFYFHAKETYYHKKDLHLAFLGKWGFCGTRKLPVDNAYFILITNTNYEKINQLNTVKPATKNLH